jgi:hypothetical protein
LIENFIITVKSVADWKVDFESNLRKKIQVLLFKAERCSWTLPCLLKIATGAQCVLAMQPAGRVCIAWLHTFKSITKYSIFPIGNIEIKINTHVKI